MKQSSSVSSVHGLGSLRSFVRKPPENERCELCALTIAEQHFHLIDPATRSLICACDACAILFSGDVHTQYRRVPRCIYCLSHFAISDQVWNSLGIPIGLAFMYKSSKSGQVIAVYPSPAGPTEAPLDEEAWSDVAANAPSLANLEQDVEALLVNRMNGARDYFRAPIDECYRLTGIVRKHWRGFSGGEEGWAKIREFFDSLKQRSYPEAVGSHAGSLI
jgi:Family of unknown function (DUF5947)